MSFELAERIPIGRLLKALFVKTDEQEILASLEEQGLGLKGKAIAFNWGRNALCTYLKSVPGKLVYLPAFTCPIISEAAEAAGKKIILLEADRQTFNIDLKKLPKKSPDVIIAVHTFGNPVDIEKIKEKYPKAIIAEDCAHALFSKLNGDYVGRLGDVVLWSLYKQVSNLNGALLTGKLSFSKPERKETITKIWKRVVIKVAGLHQAFLRKRMQGYLPEITRYSYRKQSPSPVVLSLFRFGIMNLKKETFLRRKLAGLYRDLTDKSPYFDSQQPTADSEPSYCQWAIRLKPEYIKFRDEIIRRLRQQDIFADRLWYEAPIIQRRYQGFQRQCPQALYLTRAIINLPIKGKYSKKQVKDLFETLNSMIKKSAG